MTSLAPTPPRPGAIGDILAVGFGTTTIMWTVGYLTHMPGVTVPGPVVLGLMVLSLLAGGYVAGRYMHRAWRGGIYVGLLSSVLNLLMFGSLLTAGQSNELKAAARYWIPGFLAIGALLGLLGGLLGCWRTRHSPIYRTISWKSVLAWVAVWATMLLIVFGGLVTGFRAGMAVPDWPTSFEFNMFLLPLSKMTGGTFYEHAHRLMGSLVGLTTLVLALYLVFADRRTWIKVYGLIALLAVSSQGLLGGLRVLRETHDAELRAGTMAPSFINSLLTQVQSLSGLDLAVIHGVAGQTILALLVGLAVATARAWEHGPEVQFHSGASSDRALTRILLLLILVQLWLGAMLRHYNSMMIVHISMAVVVALVALAVGVRAWGIHIQNRRLSQGGVWLMFLVVLQIVIGLVALLVRDYEAKERSAMHSYTTTLHQANGAALLLVTTYMTFWTTRLLKQPTTRV
jgi:cytochrome c oxidase assembly protein subunit 15